jgi:hypothetical protein
MPGRVAVAMGAETIQFCTRHHAGRIGAAFVSLMRNPIVGADGSERRRCQETLRLRVA